MSPTAMLAIVLAVVIAGVAGWTVTYVLVRRRVRELEQENTRLQREIEARMNLLREETAVLKKQLTERFPRRSSQALEHNSRNFHRLAEQIRREGRMPYARMVIFTEHLARLGKDLRRNVDDYNRAVGSLEHPPWSGPRRLIKMGIQPSKTLEDLPLVRVDMTARAILGPDPADRETGGNGGEGNDS